MDSMSITADYYDIQLENQVGDISNAYITQNEANCRLGVNRDGSPFDLRSTLLFHIHIDNGRAKTGCRGGIPGE